jgi:hypothetical protein
LLFFAVFELVTLHSLDKSHKETSRCHVVLDTYMCCTHLVIQDNRYNTHTYMSNRKSIHIKEQK